MRLFLAIVILLATAIVATLLYHQTQQTDINYYQGHRLFEKGKFDQAIKFYEKALAIKPSRLDALGDLAYSYQWTDSYEKAAIAFQKILSLKSHDNQIKQSLAQNLSWQKEYDKAIQLYKEVIAVTDSLDTKMQLAEVYIWNKQYDQAKEILKVILENNPRDLEAKLLFAKALQYSGEAKEAIKIYKELLQEK